VSAVRGEGGQRRDVGDSGVRVERGDIAAADLPAEADPRLADLDELPDPVVLRMRVDSVDLAFAGPLT